MTYLKFTTEASVQSAADEVYYNYLLEEADKGTDYVGDGTTDYDKAAVLAMTKADAVANLKRYGRKGVGGEPDRSKTGTTRYADPTKAINDDIWWFEKPDESLMANVTGYEEIDAIDPTWVEQNPMP